MTKQKCALTPRGAGPVKDQTQKNVKAKIKASRRRAQNAGPVRKRTQENDKAKVHPGAAERRPRARGEERSLSPGKASGAPPKKKQPLRLLFCWLQGEGSQKSQGCF